MSRASLLLHPAHLIALGFGSGLSPVAAGTSGTLWAWVSFLVLQGFLSADQMGVLLLIGLLIGWWACSVSAHLLGDNDPSMIVWDEVLAFWLVLWLWTPASFGGQCLAFALFRFFDIVKPGPVGWADRVCKEGSRWKVGFGIILDDLVAAFCTLLMLALFVFAGWAS